MKTRLKAFLAKELRRILDLIRCQYELPLRTCTDPTLLHDIIDTIRDIEKFKRKDREPGKFCINDLVELKEKSTEVTEAAKKFLGYQVKMPKFCPPEICGWLLDVEEADDILEPKEFFPNNFTTKEILDIRHDSEPSLNVLEITQPEQVVLLPDHSVVIVDRSRSYLQRISPKGELLETYDSTMLGTGPEELIKGICVKGNNLYVAVKDRIIRISHVRNDGMGPDEAVTKATVVYNLNLNNITKIQMAGGLNNDIIISTESEHGGLRV